MWCQTPDVGPVLKAMTRKAKLNRGKGHVHPPVIGMDDRPTGGLTPTTGTAPGPDTIQETPP